MTAVSHDLHLLGSTSAGVLIRKFAGFCRTYMRVLTVGGGDRFGERERA